MAHDNGTTAAQARFAAAENAYRADVYHRGLLEMQRSRDSWRAMARTIAAALVLLSLALGVLVWAVTR